MLRITPAYAGNTLNVFYMQHNRQDHPRLRGEHEIGIISRDKIVGSPPLTRGTLDAAIPKLNSVGITPAYAGNTLRSRSDIVGQQDHPRIRGEHHLTES